MAYARPNQLGDPQGSYTNSRGSLVQATDQCCRRENFTTHINGVYAEDFEDRDEHEDHAIMPFHDEPAPPYERLQRTLNFDQAGSHSEATVTSECNSSTRRVRS